MYNLFPQMSLGPSEEVRFYLNLLRNNLFGPKYDLYKIPGPPGYRFAGMIKFAPHTLQQQLLTHLLLVPLASFRYSSVGLGPSLKKACVYKQLHSSSHRDPCGTRTVLHSLAARQQNIMNHNGS